MPTFLHLGMKVPIATTQTCTTTDTIKPLLNTTFHQVPTSTPSYEPTSVLDLQRSPSPASKPTDTVATIHHNPTVDLDNLEGWDSILSELGLNDSTPLDSHNHHHHPLTQLPDFPSSQPFDHSPTFPPPSDLTFSDFSFNNPHFTPFDLQHTNTNTNTNATYGLDFIDDLIRAAQSFESNDHHQVHAILARLNQRLRSPSGKPLQRAAFYFKEALNQIVVSSPGPKPSPTRPTQLTSYEVVQTIRAHKSFSGISPISLFSTFAANQAILEAVEGAPFIHVLDFDVGFGGHWASFMRELVDKSDPNKITSMVLRITAVVPEEFAVEGKLVRENLTQFARDLGINFHIEFVLIHTFEMLHFKAIKFIEGERLAIHLSPCVFLKLRVSKFLNELRGMSPSIVVVVDKEAGVDTGSSSFSVNFVAGVEFYTGMLESLDVAVAGGFAGAGGDCVRRIENFVLKPRIMAAVEAAAAVAGGERKAVWREAFVAAGLKSVGFSQFADFQAECLLRRAQVGGFHVAKRHGEMMLCWQERPLVSTSAWRC